MKDIQTYADHLMVDFSNSTNLRRILEGLCAEEYIEQIVSGQGRTAKYALRFNYRIDEQGNVDLSWNGRGFNLMAPDELQAAIEAGK